MRTTVAFACVILADVLAAVFVLSYNTCNDECLSNKVSSAFAPIQAAATTSLIQVRKQLDRDLYPVTMRNATSGLNRRNYSSVPLTGSPENLITLGDTKQADERLMEYRAWMKEALSQLPDRQLDVREAPGQWYHSCRDNAELAALQAATPKIPRHLHFVLIEERSAWIDKSDPSRLIGKDSETYSELTGYEQLLIENMRYTIAMHDMKSIHLMDDEACIHATGKWSARLRYIYEDEADIRFKSDICRIAALYWEGGYYMDDDMVTYQPLILGDDTDFATALGVAERSMFQSYLASSPCHPILARNIELLLAARSKKVPDYLQSSLREDSGLLGPVTLRLAWEEAKSIHSRLFHEVRHNASYPVEPDRGGLTCEFVVVDTSSNSLHYCSRF
mmetsp:Transcript_82332/g.156549  ORF Transcript_82332/g.156549 Transcript_82332/m.156549 type:complete len:391 (+) Transcript_82332:53-1225(+)